MNVAPIGKADDERPTYLVTDTIMAKSGSAIDADIEAEGFRCPEGTIIATAGYQTMKQKGLDGSWSNI